MRKITSESVSAFLNKKPFRKSNMSVDSYGNEFRLQLHGNTIAKIDELGNIWVSNGGWDSHTTKERLNGIPGVRVHQRNWKWYLNGILWDGNFTIASKI
jgi:hypothetical protein